MGNDVLDLLGNEYQVSYDSTQFISKVLFKT